MSAAPPADYVAYVGQRLPQLRDRVAREVPATACDEVLGEVLTGLAARWALLRVADRLGRPGPAERCLDRLVRRRAQAWRDRQIYPVEMTVWADAPDRPARPAPRASETPRAGVAPRASVALRRAPVLDSTVRAPLAPLAEASMAWWHAFEARRRAGRVARATAAVLVLLFLWTVSS